MTTTRARNYRKNPHTASFLQTFHTATREADRKANAEAEMTNPTEEAQAVAFVRPTATARNDGSYMAEVKGYQVRLGGTFVSEAQAKWMIDIATTRVLPTGATAESLLVRLEQGFAKFAGSQFITKYKDLPRVTAAMAEAVAPGATTEEIQTAFGTPAGTVVRETHSTVAPGRYALVRDGVTKFYRVTEGKGRWAGRTFISVQASDDLHSIRNPQERAEILKLIAANPAEAATRYGVELGSCHRCGRTLTDAVSRSLGIGPDCRSK